QYWPHGAPTADQQASSEAWYINRLLNGEIAQPVLNSSDDLYVAGFVKTTPFEFWLGDGQNAAGDLTYSLSSTAKTFHLEVLSSNLSIASLLKVDTEDMDGKEVQVLLDGELVDTFVGGGVYQYSGLLDGSTVTFSAVPEPGTIALLLAGGAALAVWTVRRRR
ncbi:MAG: PEP-CTERM sorting domain-containing protein, partial [Thermoguttaceae bacterium]